MVREINDWFDMHLAREPHGGRACITYQYDNEPRHLTLELANGIKAGCRGDPTLNGEFPTVTIHSLCNEDTANGNWVGLLGPYTIPQQPSLDILAATVVVEGDTARACVRWENGTCSPWEPLPVIAGLPECHCEPGEPGQPCKTQPCPDE